MAYQLNSKIEKLVPYEPISGEYEIRLDANESFLELPPRLYQKAIEKATELPLSRYPDYRAKDLCCAFADCYNVPFDCVMAGNGSDELISIIAGAFFEKGDELITLDKDFSMYRFYADVYEVKTSIFPKNSELRIDVDSLIDYANASNSKGIIFSNPCNPTSLCLSKSDVLKLVSSVDCLVIVDEAYMDFADSSVLSKVSDFNNLIVLKTCSKAIGLASIRLGFAISNKRITDALLAVKSPYNVNSITQCIGEVVLSDQQYIAECTEKIIFSRDHLYNSILRLHTKSNVFDEVYQTETNFVFIKTNYSKSIFKALCKRSIVIREMNGYLRITAGNKQENEKLLLELSKIVAAISNQNAI